MQIHQRGRWKPASEAYREFAESHPEFGIKGNGNSWIHFQRTHAPRLIEAGVLRRAAFRNRMIADTERFEGAVFDLLSGFHHD